jgi:hypothetical protein
LLRCELKDAEITAVGHFRPIPPARAMSAMPPITTKLVTRPDGRKVPKLTFGVQIGGNVLAACFIIDLPELGGAEKIRKLGVPVRTLVSFEGH